MAFYGREDQEGPLPIPPHLFSLWPPGSLTHSWLTPRPPIFTASSHCSGGRWEGLHLPEALRLSQVLGPQICGGILPEPELSGLHLSEPLSLHLESGGEARTCRLMGLGVLCVADSVPWLGCSGLPLSTH